MVEEKSKNTITPLITPPGSFEQWAQKIRGLKNWGGLKCSATSFHEGSINPSKNRDKRVVIYLHGFSLAASTQHFENSVLASLYEGVSSGLSCILSGANLLHPQQWGVAGWSSTARFWMSLSSARSTRGAPRSSSCMLASHPPYSPHPH